METKQNQELDALYLAWHENAASDNPTTLREWTKRYPEQATELAQWAADAPVLNYAEGCDPDPAGEARTLAIGRRVVAEMRARYMANAAPAISSLLEVARQRGLNARTLAERLQVGMPIIAKLNQRLIVAASLPDTLIARLAETLATGTEAVRAYLNQPPTLAAAASYKSNGVPQATEPEDFAQAVRACADMTPEQQRFWLNELSGQREATNPN